MINGINFISIYHHLPYPLKVFVASTKGYQLQHLRYGKNTEQMVEKAVERETWDENQWKMWQAERLEFVLNRSVKAVPYYRRYWEEQRKNGNRASWIYLENWPILKKEEVRKNPLAFVAEDCNPRKMYCDHTSGTSGTPLKIWESTKTIQQWYALFEARWRRWYGVSRFDRWAILGGQLVVPFEWVKPPFWVWNAGMKQLYCSAYHINPENVPFYIDAIRRHGVKYLLGYPSAIFALAQTAFQLKLSPPVLKVVISNAEPLFSFQKQMIREFFECPVYDTYGMAEFVCAASQCSEGVYHLWPEVGHLEVVSDDSDESVQDGETGRLICTGLLNVNMPLIRYEVGDRGAQNAAIKECGCGRSLPRLLSIEGRQDDVILTRDGRRIGRLDPIFKTDLHLLEAQIIQEEIGKFKVKYVPAPEWNERDENILAERLRQRVGDVCVDFETVNAIPRSRNGKFKAVISQIQGNLHE